MTSKTRSAALSIKPAKSWLAKLTEQGSHTGIVISSLRRNNGNWDFTALGHACRGRTIDDMHSDIVSAVIR